MPQIVRSKPMAGIFLFMFAILFTIGAPAFIFAVAMVFFST